jgi:acetyl esterase/lipase
MERDLDGNGRLTEAESGVNPIAFAKLDRSNNETLSWDEFESYWKSVSPKPTLANLSYGKDASQVLDLYLPPNLEAPVPLVVWIHGGSWKSGSKDSCPLSTLTKEGFAVAAINHRPSTRAKFPAQIKDCESAVEFLTRPDSVPGATFREVSACGLSSGGHLASLLNVRGRVPKAVSFGGPTDLTQHEAARTYRETLESLVGAPLQAHQAELKAASPIYSLQPGVGSLLLFHGTGDRVIPYTESLTLAAEAAKVRLPVILNLVPSGSHSLVGGPQGWRLLVDFLRSP